MLTLPAAAWTAAGSTYLFWAGSGALLAAP